LASSQTVFSRLDTLPDNALHAGSSSLLNSAHTFKGREIAQIAHILTVKDFTCGACITGTSQKDLIS
jgi:hypothetical protein